MQEIDGSVLEGVNILIKIKIRTISAYILF